MLWRSRDKRFPAMGKCLERDLSRLLLYRQVNVIENISNKNLFRRSSSSQKTNFLIASYPDCGRQARRTLETTSVYERIHVRGCISVVGRALEEHVMPMLMAWGLLGIMVALAELLLLFLCLLFANHLRSGAGHTRLTTSPGKCELEPLAYTSTATLSRQQKYTSTLSVRLT